MINNKELRMRRIELAIKSTKTYDINRSIHSLKSFHTNNCVYYVCMGIPFSYPFT